MGKSTLNLDLIFWCILFVYITSEEIYLLPSTMAQQISKSKQGNFIACRLPAIKNGKVKIRNHGRKIKYKCFKPSTLIGTPRASCVNGKWFPSDPPVCAKVGCSELEGTQHKNNNNEILNGFYESVVPGSFLKFHCHPGHYLKGSKTTFCDGFHWSSPVPTCLSIRQEPELVIDFDECLTKSNTR